MNYFRPVLTFAVLSMVCAYAPWSSRIGVAVGGEPKSGGAEAPMKQAPRMVLEACGVTPENAVKVRITGLEYTFTKPLAVKILVRTLAEVSERVDNPDAHKHGYHDALRLSFEVEGPGNARATIPFAIRGLGKICCIADQYKPLEPLLTFTRLVWNIKSVPREELDKKDYENLRKRFRSSLPANELKEKMQVSDEWKETCFRPEEIAPGTDLGLVLGPADKLAGWMEIIRHYEPKGTGNIENRDLLAWAYNEALSMLVELNRWNEFEPTLAAYERLFGADSRPSRLWPSLTYAQDAQLKAMWHRIVALDKQGRRKEALEMKLKSHESWMRLFDQHRAKLTPSDLFRDYAGFYWRTPLEIGKRYRELGQYEEALAWYRKVQGHWADEGAFRDFKGQRSEEMEKGEKDLRNDLETRIRKFNLDELPKLVAECEQKAKETKQPHDRQ